MAIPIPTKEMLKWKAENACNLRIDTQWESRHGLAKELSKQCEGRRKGYRNYCPIGFMLCPLGFPFAPCLPENDTEITPELWLIHIHEQKGV